MMLFASGCVGHSVCQAKGWTIPSFSLHKRRTDMARQGELNCETFSGVSGGGGVSWGLFIEHHRQNYRKDSTRVALGSASPTHERQVEGKIL